MPDRTSNSSRPAIWLSVILCCAAGLACAGSVPTVAESDQAYQRAASLERGDSAQRRAAPTRYRAASGKSSYEGSPSRVTKTEGAEAWLAHSRRGRKLLSSGDHQGAESEFLAALDASSAMPDRDVRTQTALTNVERLANLYAHTGDEQGTIRITPRLVEGVERLRGPDDRALSLAYQRLGQAHFLRDEFEAAADAFNRSLQYHEAGNGHSESDVVEVMGNLGQSYESLGKIEAAESLHLSSLEAAETGGSEDRSLALALNRLAWFYTEQGRHAEAEPLARRAVQIADLISAPRQVSAAVLDTLATALTGTGSLDEADEVFERAAKASKGTEAELEILTKHAAVLARLGRADEAKELRDRASGIETSEPPADAEAEQTDSAEGTETSESEAPSESDENE